MAPFRLKTQTSPLCSAPLRAPLGADLLPRRERHADASSDGSEKVSTALMRLLLAGRRARTTSFPASRWAMGGATSTAPRPRLAARLGAWVERHGPAARSGRAQLAARGRHPHGAAGEQLGHARAAGRSRLGGRRRRPTMAARAHGPAGPKRGLRSGQLPQPGASAHRLAAARREATTPAERSRALGSAPLPASRTSKRALHQGAVLVRARCRRLGRGRRRGALARRRARMPQINGVTGDRIDNATVDRVRRRVACFGLPQPLLGQRALAVVATPVALLRPRVRVRQRLAAHKRHKVGTLRRVDLAWWPRPPLSLGVHVKRFSASSSPSALSVPQHRLRGGPAGHPQAVVDVQFFARVQQRHGHRVEVASNRPTRRKRLVARPEPGAHPLGPALRVRQHLGSWPLVREAVDAKTARAESMRSTRAARRDQAPAHGQLAVAAAAAGDKPRQPARRESGRQRGFEHRLGDVGVEGDRRRRRAAAWCAPRRRCGVAEVDDLRGASSSMPRPSARPRTTRGVERLDSWASMRSASSRAWRRLVSAAADGRRDEHERAAAPTRRRRRQRAAVHAADVDAVDLARGWARASKRAAGAVLQQLELRRAAREAGRGGPVR